MNSAAQTHKPDETEIRATQQFRDDLNSMIRDLGSSNGTYFDTERIDVVVELSDGVEVQVGKFKFTFFASRFDLPGQY